MKDPEDQKMWDVLEEMFGDSPAPFVNVEQTVIDHDVDRWRQEEKDALAHLEAYGSRVADRVAASHRINVARRAIARLGDIPPDRVWMRDLSCAVGTMAPRECPHSTQSKYLVEDDLRCSDCDENGGAVARYTLVLYRSAGVEKRVAEVTTGAVR